MANRKLTVYPSGYQKLLQAGDTLLIDGDINLQSNGLTGVTVPVADTDAASKKYVDDELSAEAQCYKQTLMKLSAETADATYRIRLIH